VFPVADKVAEADEKHGAKNLGLLARYMGEMGRLFTKPRFPGRVRRSCPLLVVVGVM